KDYSQAILKEVEGLGLKLVFEPGRVIVGNAGILVTKVLYRKDTPNKTFIIVDAGMNDLIRPSFYKAYHDIWPVEIKIKDGVKEKVDVVGPICESGDFLAKDRDAPRFTRGDLLAVMSAGAYGFTMSSNYNSRPRLTEVLADGSRYYVITKRQTYDDLISGEIVPEFIS
ncbi:MAG: diaminopimelate decarboxylase, partial [Thermodesulfobacteriota bacterium]|nr:diaminopimelate decarboxylase [Thermodesulfobacteriota bacterium]